MDTTIKYNGATYNQASLVALHARDKAGFLKLKKELKASEDGDAVDDLYDLVLNAELAVSQIEAGEISGTTSKVIGVHKSFAEALVKIADGKAASVAANKKPHNYTIILDRKGKALVCKNGFHAFFIVMFCGAKYDGNKMELKSYARSENFNQRTHHLLKLTKLSTPFDAQIIEQERNALASDLEFLEAKLGENHPVCQSLSSKLDEANAYLSGMRSIPEHIRASISSNLTTIQTLLDPDHDLDINAFNAALFKAQDNFDMDVDSDTCVLPDEHIIRDKVAAFIENARAKAQKRLTASDDSPSVLSDDVASTASVETETGLPFDLNSVQLPSLVDGSPTTVMRRPDFPALPPTPQEDKRFDQFIKTIDLPGVSKHQSILPPDATLNL